MNLAGDDRRDMNMDGWVVPIGRPAIKRVPYKTGDICHAITSVLITLTPYLNNSPARGGQE